MKWAVLFIIFCGGLKADYAAWFGMTPAFRFESSDDAPATLAVEWSEGISWPETAPRYERLPHPLTKEVRDKLVRSFGSGPWNVYLEADDKKGFWVLSRRMTEAALSTEAPDEDAPKLPSVPERIEKAKALLSEIGYPVETLAVTGPRSWVEGEGAQGAETDIAAGVTMGATIGGYRLLPASAQAASLGFDRHGRTTEVRLVWRKVRTAGQFRIISREQAEEIIMGGGARSLHFGLARQWGAPATPEQKATEAFIQDERSKRKASGLPPLVVERRLVVTAAELVLLDYASEEGAYGDEEPFAGKFDDVLWPVLVLTGELFTNGRSEKGEMRIPADGAWLTQLMQPKAKPALPTAGGRR